MLGVWLLYSRRSLAKRSATVSRVRADAAAQAPGPVLWKLRTLLFPRTGILSAGSPKGASGPEKILPRLAVLRGLLEHLDSPEEGCLHSLLLGELLVPGDVEAGAVCRFDDTGQPLLIAYAPGSEPRERETLLHALIDASERDASHPLTELRVGGYYWLSLEICPQGESDALLLLRIPPGARLGVDVRARYSRVAIEFSAILKRIYRERSNRRRLLYQERAMIARELHDSLAQSLSYLKIQVARLEALAREGDTRPGEVSLHSASGVIRELDDNLDLAYRQLRELITTFRMTMHGRSLSEALECSVEEFENRSSIAFQVDNRLPEGVLSVAEEMQVLQIVREALSNAVRHSRARRVRVSLEQEQDNETCVLVDDDGQGFPTQKKHHSGYGLEIMRQRVHGLNGRLSLECAPLGGARVCLRFRAADGLPEAGLQGDA